MLNKKANAAIVFLVLMILVLTVVTVFAFLKSSEKIQVKVFDSNNINVLYSQENWMKFYIHDAMERALLQTYVEFIKGEGLYDFVQARKEFDLLGEKVFEFSDLHSKLNENFVKRFNENFKEAFKYYSLDEDLRNAILDDKTLIEFDGEKIKMIINGVEFNQNFDGVEILYKPEIIVEVNLNDAGVESFNDILDAKDFCQFAQEQSVMMGCFNDRLKIFDVSVDERGEYFLIFISSKKKLFIGEEFKQIEMKFVILKIKKDL